MTGNYQDEIHAFFTERKNFENMLKVVSHFNPVKNRLIEEFWKEVEKELNQSNITEGNNQWIITLDNDILSNYSKLMIYKPSWRLNDDLIRVAIVAERLSGGCYYGLWVNQDDRNSKKEQLLNGIRSQNKDSAFRMDANLWWAFWQYFNFNFNNHETLDLLLPDKRMSQATYISSLLLKLAKDKEKEVDKLLD